MVKPEQEQEREPEKAEGGPSGFTVTDRRFWVRQAEGAEAVEEYRGPRHPTYVEELEAKLASNDKRLQELAGAYKRLQEDMDSFRARLHRDLERRVEQEKAALLVPFLSMIDDLDRAIEAARASNDAAPLCEGMELIRNRLSEQLARNGVVAIEVVGGAFNPQTQEAVEVVSVQDPEEDGKVVKEVARGYMLREQLVRPAKVAVGRWNAGNEGSGSVADADTLG